MAIDLSGGQNVAAGWPGPPQLSAPNIGELVKSILANRLARDEMTQKSIADTIKNVRQNREANIYLDTARKLGLVPEDSDLSGAYGASYAKTLADDVRQKLEGESLGNYRNRMARVAEDRLNQADQYPDEVPEPKLINGILHYPRMDAHGRINWVPYQPSLQPNLPGDEPSTATQLKTLGLTGPDITASESQYGTLASGERVPAGHPWTEASTIHITPSGGGAEVPLTIEKFRQLKKALGVPDPNPTPMPSVTPSANPDVTAGPLPTATPRPNQPQADQNLAPGYGVPSGGGGGGDIAPSRDQAQIGQLYRASDGSVKRRTS